MAPDEPSSGLGIADEYVPCQHKARVAGRASPVLFANVEICDERPPELIRLGRNLYKIVEKSS